MWGYRGPMPTKEVIKMTILTRPKCPRCGQRWTEPLEIPEEMLRSTMKTIAKNGGLHCDDCINEVNQLWSRVVIQAQTYLQ